MRFIPVSSNAQDAAPFHRFEAVFDNVVKRLLHLVAIELEQWQIGVQFRFHDNVARFDFGGEETHRFLHNAIDIFRPKLWTGGPDGPEELTDDGIQPVNFTAADVDGVLEFFAGVTSYFACLPFHQLQMDVQGVKGVAEFMGDTSGEQRERVESLALDRFFRCASALGDVAHDNGVTDLLRSRCRHGRCPGLFFRIALAAQTAVSDYSYGVFARLDHQRHAVKVDEPISRIKNFHVARDRTAAVSQRVPIETPHAFVELFADGIFAGESKKLNRKSTRLNSSHVEISY